MKGMSIVCVCNLIQQDLVRWACVALLTSLRGLNYKQINCKKEFYLLPYSGFSRSEHNLKLIIARREFKPPLLVCINIERRIFVNQSAQIAGESDLTIDC
jgi:hypothetical protein